MQNFSNLKAHVQVMREYIDKKGLFRTFYVDRAGIIFGGPTKIEPI